MPGHICIGGATVARGYLGNPSLTDRNFRDDPYDNGGRLYLTGDRGRWMDDGRLEFLGRADRQVKIRGYRVELSDVEHTLETHPDVAEAVALFTAPDSDPSDTASDLDELASALGRLRAPEAARLLADVSATPEPES